jgi:hypothetical protein
MREIVQLWKGVQVLDSGLGDCGESVTAVEVDRETLYWPLVGSPG